MKKILLFIFLQLVWVVLLISGLWLYQTNLPVSLDKISDVTITIKSGNVKNDKLILEPAGEVKVSNGTVVNWVIDPSSNVDSFRIEKKWLFSTQIFKDRHRPPARLTRRGSGTVDSFKTSKKYRYNIYWIKKGETEEKKFDPKLAIKPIGLDKLNLVIYSVYGVLALSTFSVFRTKKVKTQ